jgi:membrane-associated phospholipid phosphatase
MCFAKICFLGSKHEHQKLSIMKKKIIFINSFIIFVLKKTKMLETLIRIDIFLFRIINSDLSNQYFDLIMPIVRNKLTWVPLYLLVALVLIYTKKKHAFYIITGAVVCVGFTDIVSSHVLKELFERTRPCLHTYLFSDVKLLLSNCSQGYSFPSSHAANHFAMAVFISILMYKQSKIWVYASLTWAALIGFAQIYVGVHFPADIIFGMFIGSLIALFVSNFTINFIEKIKQPT